MLDLTPFAIILSSFLGGPADSDGLRVRLVTERVHYNVGAPIAVRFVVENLLDETKPLMVPGTDPDRFEQSIMGLPMTHVFSGDAFGALTIKNDADRTWNVADGYQPPASAPVVMLGPRNSIGVTLNIRDYYPALRTPGTYRIRWKPYGGRVESNVVAIRVESLKQAEIVTDSGEMIVRFYYEDAPRTIDNFIELAKDRFYDNKTFHRVETGFLIQGGCPNGDGTGIRPDGKKVSAEISGLPQNKGVVSMALLDDDPNSASCQFFITNTSVPEWSGKYTTFGELVGEASFATLDRLMAVETDGQGKPLTGIRIRTIRINDAPRDREAERPFE